MLYSRIVTVTRPLMNKSASHYCSWVLVLPLLCGHHPFVYGESVEAIIDSWQNYDSLIDTAQFKYAIDRTQNYSTDASKLEALVGLPVPADTVDSEVVTLKRKLSVNISGKKTVVVKRGEFWDGNLLKPIQNHQSFGFDGSQVWKILGHPGGALGKIEHGVVPHDTTIRDIEVTPIFFTCSPIELLKLKGFDIGEISMANESVVYNGTDSVKLSLPARKASPLEVVAVYIDPARDNRILGFERWYKGAPLKEITLNYAETGKVGWQLANWKSTIFDYASGEPAVSVSGEVTEVTINEPVADSLFEPVFPEGTHVRKMGETFIQGPDGKLRPLEEGEFGKPSPLKLAGGITL